MTLDPDISEVLQCLLVVRVLSLHCEGDVVHQCDGPELRDGFDKISAALIDINKFLLGLAF